MSLSAAIIVKNEESVMQRCLDCVSLWADEIVIVDTGSTDRTKEIAAAHPKVKLYDSVHFNKDTDFSDFQFNVAKNEAIAKCTKDWIIWWDADDTIDEECAGKICELARTTTDDCLYSFVCAYGTLRFEHCRMFRNWVGIEFDKNHSCHEFLNSGGRPTQMRNDIVTVHKPGKRGVPSNVRNLAIMEKDYFERGYKDQRTMFYLANTYRESGRHDDAVKMYDEYLKVSGWKEERYFASLYKAQVYAAVGNFDDAFPAIYKSFLEDDRFAESYCLMGDIYFHVKKYAKAKPWYEIALGMEPPKDSRLFVAKSQYDTYPRERLKRIAEALGKPEKAAKAPTEVRDEKQYKYRLPTNRELVSPALAALSLVAVDKWVTVIAADEWQSKQITLHGLSVAEGKGMELELPDDLRDKCKVEWYCRSAGFVKEGPFPKPLKLESENVA